MLLNMQLPPTASQLIVAALLSGTVAGAIVGTILKFVFDGMLERAKLSLQRQLEETKSLLQRASVVHTKQVDALTELYAYLSDIHDGIVRFAGTSNDFELAKDLGQKVDADIEATKALFRTKRLLLPTELEGEVQLFLMDLPWILRPLHATLGMKQIDVMQDPTKREYDYTPLDAEVNTRMTSLLRHIADSARNLIHTRPLED